MTPEQELTAKVHGWVGQVQAGNAIESSVVECKKVFPEIQKGARQLAGMANAALGSNIVWLIGIDEKVHNVSTTAGVDATQWWEQVSSRFDGEYPALELLLPVQVSATEQVFALEFSTRRAPYVINLAGEATEREVPWRDGMRTRSAHKFEIEKILAPGFSRPQIQIVKGNVLANWKRRNPRADAELIFDVHATIRVIPREPLLLPREGVAGVLTLHEMKNDPAFDQLNLQLVQLPNIRNPSGVRAASDGLVIDAVGHAPLHLHGSAGTSDPTGRKKNCPYLTLRLTLQFVAVEEDVVVMARFGEQRVTTNGSEWSMIGA